MSEAADQAVAVSAAGTKTAAAARLPHDLSPAVAIQAAAVSAAALAMARRVADSEVRAIARLISYLEDGNPEAVEVMKALRGRKGHAHVLGITGPPGSGKSTLTDKLIKELRKRGSRVAVVAVDPSSPFTGGAILGDRLRMNEHATDEGVYIRSLASRGRLGGLSKATGPAVRVLAAAGFDYVIIETVGVGQSEVDVMRVADTVVLVSVPGLGDDIQVIKAGIMEIGDVFVVNKSDRDGADRVVREIKAMLETARSLKARHQAPARDSVDTLAAAHHRGSVTGVGSGVAPAATRGEAPGLGGGLEASAVPDPDGRAAPEGAAFGTVAATGGPSGNQGGQVASLAMSEAELAAHLMLGPAGEPGASSSGDEPAAASKAASPAASSGADGEYEPIAPVLKTVAETGEGVVALVDAIVAHRVQIESSGELLKRRLEGVRAQMRHLMAYRLLDALEGDAGRRREAELSKAVLADEVDVFGAADELFGALFGTKEEIVEGS